MKSKRERIERELAKGTRPSIVAEKIGVTAAYVSNIKSQMAKGRVAAQTATANGHAAAHSPSDAWGPFAGPLDLTIARLDGTGKVVKADTLRAAVTLIRHAGTIEGAVDAIALVSGILNDLGGKVSEPATKHVEAAA
jgi:hypothetical protein